MTPNTIIPGDALAVLRTLPDNSVDCCVTSPPYYGLRDYGTATWEGGDTNCLHSAREEKGFENYKQSSIRGNSKPPKNRCKKCGAVRIDNQIGLEDTPEAYISKLVEVFMEVRRVLKPTGTLWIVIGDSYNGSGKNGGNTCKKEWKQHTNVASHATKPTLVPGLKPKDLIGIPWMLAFALRNAGWWLRQDIIWHKPYPMPRSVTDRCTEAHEYMFLLSKKRKYYYDNKAIMETAAYDGRKDTRMKGSHKYSQPGITGLSPQTFAARSHERWTIKDGVYMRNKRSVWSVNTKPYRGAHFATYPPKLITPCIRAGCPENGIVLDPFMGSGTTAVVARKLNRNFIGIELNPEYIEMAEERLRNELGMWL
ncbi:MAG: site-specific DNA-methyltransferase [Prevotellaceae bacterium]|jgi:DNA modification methylase|nr:site-specific DNA-methyltransferase [Prevotellaceae bacterium]